MKEKLPNKHKTPESLLVKIQKPSKNPIKQYRKKNSSLFLLSVEMIERLHFTHNFYNVHLLLSTILIALLSVIIC